MSSNNLASNRTIQSCFNQGSTHIPLPKSYTSSKTLTSPNQGANFNSDKYKLKFEEADRQRKALLIQNEKTLRDYNDLDRKFQLLKIENKVVQSELSEKTNQLKELSSVSQSFYKEYDTLKNQYDIETTAMHRALSEAEQWYKQNQQLKRMSMAGGPNAALMDVVDSGEDLDALKKSIKDLSSSNAKLQTELNEAKLAEFEANEQVINLTQELETLEKRCANLESELKDIRQRNEQLMRVSKKMSEELLDIKTNEEKQKVDLLILRKEADDARKERNVLAHQSNLLMQGISLDNDKIMLIQEIEGLKRELEDNTNKYERQIFELQEKLEERDEDSRLELAEERLKLAENELAHARQKLEEMEREKERRKSQTQFQKEMKSDEILTCTDLHIPKAVPPPPPPPPPPMPEDIVNCNSPTNFPKVQLRKMSKTALISLDNKIPNEKVLENVQNGIENIVNQIKGGQFTLKSTKRPPVNKQREEPKVVNEMLQILGTLRRSPKNRQSLLLTHGTTDF